MSADPIFSRMDGKRGSMVSGCSRSAAFYRARGSSAVSPSSVYSPATERRVEKPCQRSCHLTPGPHPGNQRRLLYASIIQTRRQKVPRLRLHLMRCRLISARASTASVCSTELRESTPVANSVIVLGWGGDWGYHHGARGMLPGGVDVVGAGLTSPASRALGEYQKTLPKIDLGRRIPAKETIASRVDAGDAFLLTRCQVGLVGGRAARLALSFSGCDAGC